MQTRLESCDHPQLQLFLSTSGSYDRLTFRTDISILAPSIGLPLVLQIC